MKQDLIYETGVIQAATVYKKNPEKGLDLIRKYMTKPYSSPLRRQRHEFLLTFFDTEKKYQVKEVNGWILVKYFNKGSNHWEVAIYRKEAWEKVLAWKQNQK